MRGDQQPLKNNRRIFRNNIYCRRRTAPADRCSEISTLSRWFGSFAGSGPHLLPSPRVPRRRPHSVFLATMAHNISHQPLRFLPRRRINFELALVACARILGDLNAHAAGLAYLLFLDFSLPLTARKLSKLLLKGEPACVCGRRRTLERNHTRPHKSRCPLRKRIGSRA